MLLSLGVSRNCWRPLWAGLFISGLLTRLKFLIYVVFILLREFTRLLNRLKLIGFVR